MYLYNSIDSDCRLFISVQVMTTTWYLVLAEQEGQQHQHASIMDDPPHVDVTLSEAFAVGREGCDILWDQQSQVSGCGFSDQLCWIQRQAQ